MIVYSENDAADILCTNAKAADINSVFKDFNIDTIATMKDYMSIYQYMNVLRTLYKATYLSKANSDYALRLLTRSDFNNGIRAGLPDGIPVASKFGERGYNKSLQLHDCGIVYYGNQPYLIGIMTKGTDFKLMQQTIKSVSAQIFDVVRKEGAIAQK